MKSIPFNNFGYIEDKLPSNLFNNIKNNILPYPKNKKKRKTK